MFRRYHVSSAGLESAGATREATFIRATHTCDAGKAPWLVSWEWEIVQTSSRVRQCVVQCRGVGACLFLAGVAPGPVALRWCGLDCVGWLALVPLLGIQVC